MMKIMMAMMMMMMMMMMTMMMVMMAMAMMTCRIRWAVGHLTSEASAPTIAEGCSAANR